MIKPSVVFKWYAHYLYTRIVYSVNQQWQLSSGLINTSNVVTHGTVNTA